MLPPQYENLAGGDANDETGPEVWKVAVTAENVFPCLGWLNINYDIAAATIN